MNRENLITIAFFTLVVIIALTAFVVFSLLYGIALWFLWKLSIGPMTGLQLDMWTAAVFTLVLRILGGFQIGWVLKGKNDA